MSGAGSSFYRQPFGELVRQHDLLLLRHVLQRCHDLQQMGPTRNTQTLHSTLGLDSRGYAAGRAGLLRYIYITRKICWNKVGHVRCAGVGTCVGMNGGTRGTLVRDSESQQRATLEAMAGHGVAAPAPSKALAPSQRGNDSAQVRSPGTSCTVTRAHEALVRSERMSWREETSEAANQVT